MFGRLAALLVLLMPVAASAADKLADGKVTAEVLADVATVRADEPFRVGVLLRMAPEWHVYWKNSGEAGLPTEITFHGDTVEVGALAWPVPRRLLSRDGFITTYGYEGEVLLFAPARARASGEVRVDIDLLVCKIDCIPGQASLALPVVVGSDTRPSEAAARFDAEAARVPRSATAAGVTLDTRITPRAVAAGSGFTVEIEGTCPAPCTLATDPFFPDATRSVALGVSGSRAEGQRFFVTLAGKVGPDAPGPSLGGVIAFADGSGVEWQAPLPRGAPTAPATPPLLVLLGLAFLGGIILNLMPCVLPVLAIKVISFTRVAGEGPAAAAVHGAAYAAGIQAALAVLAVAVLALRALGTEVGWGFQFQEPAFVAVAGVLLVLLALNAFGVLELGLSLGGATSAVSRSHGLLRSAGEGVLAVVLATPCSAPFLGTAVGVALVGPAPLVPAVFAALGLGLAAPFVLLTLVPGARRLVPRPGPWMERAKELVGFALLGATVWLLWIFGRQMGPEGTASLLAFWLLAAFCGWLVGRARRKWLAIAASAVLLVVGADRTLGERPAEAGPAWRPYDESAVAADLAAGRAVFVDFTADWCITCKVNERVAIDTDPVKKKVEETAVVLYRADYTRKNETIRRALARHGKAGVPMYLVYSPAAPDAPEVLPELLTESRVLEALDRASPRRMQR